MDGLECAGLVARGIESSKAGANRMSRVGMPNFRFVMGPSANMLV